MAESVDITEANRAAWNARAANYDSEEYLQKINTQIVSALRSRLDWIGAPWIDVKDDRDKVVGGGEGREGERECRLLDYACGTGKITRALQPYITSAKGIDISTAMLKVYNTTIPQQQQADGHGDGFHASAHLGDFCTEGAPHPPLTDPEFAGFDIAAIGLGFHHFDKPELCLKRLAERVKVGTGVVLIVDWLPSGDHHGHGHGHSHHGDGHQGNHGGSGEAAEKKQDEWEAMQKTVKHHGFDEPAMRNMFQEAGFVDFAFEVLEEPFVLLPKGRRIVKTGFLARGRRA